MGRDSHIRFSAPDGEMERTSLCPEFPPHIELTAQR